MSSLPPDQRPVWHHDGRMRDGPGVCHNNHTTRVEESRDQWPLLTTVNIS
jgi:hypothetical protein